MGTIQSRVIGAGLFFLFILLSGFWLSHAGGPLNGLILTIHKLISVAAIVWLGVTVHRVNQGAALGGMAWLAVIVSGLFFLGTIATGGLLSIEKTMPAVVLRLHQVTPYLTTLSSVATLYFLSGR